MNLRAANQQSFVRPNATAGQALAARPQNADPAAPPTGASELATRGRLDEAGARFDERLSQLLENGTLTREEAAAVAEARDEFEALVARMDNALAQGGLQQEGKLGRAFHAAVDGLRDDVRAALGGPTPAGATATSEVAPDADDAAGLAARLGAAFDRVDARLANLIDGRGGDDARRLDGVQDKFGAVFDRLENAVAQGMDPAALGDLFERMLGGLRDAVTGGPQLYDASSSVRSVAGAGGPRHLDTTA
ncbi:MAG: hypothetical protein H6828_06650 [Planctomycetes bacterium]|nr:hypothetical protein [Planctomycetota bacterium]